MGETKYVLQQRARNTRGRVDDNQNGFDQPRALAMRLHRAHKDTHAHTRIACVFISLVSHTHTYTAQVCCARVRFYSQTTQRACVERRSMETGLVDARKRLISPCAKCTRSVRWICLSPPPCLSPVAGECVCVELLRCRLRTQVSTSERLMYIQWRTQKCYT